jgi:hypothetical protein
MKTYKNILTDEKAPLVALLWVVAEKYGPKAFEWLPMILRDELEQDADCSITDVQADRIQAAIAAVSTNMYETDVRTFEVCTRLACGIPQDFEDLHPLEAEELVSGMTEIYVLKGEKLEYSDEVNRYAGEIFFEYGFTAAPELFPTAIMPEVTAKDSSQDKEKNEALAEILEQRIDFLASYMKDIKS